VESAVKDTGGFAFTLTLPIAFAEVTADASQLGHVSAIPVVRGSLAFVYRLFFSEENDLFHGSGLTPHVT
jgi:hypothetical protein